MIFLELTIKGGTKILLNPSSIETISDNDDHATIITKSGNEYKTEANFEGIKVVLKRALRRK